MFQKTLQGAEMNRFKKITKDIDGFAIWYSKIKFICSNCIYFKEEYGKCKDRCKEGIKKYFEEEVE